MSSAKPSRDRPSAKRAVDESRMKREVGVRSRGWSNLARALARHGGSDAAADIGSSHPIDVDGCEGCEARERVQHSRRPGPRSTRRAALRVGPMRASPTLGARQRAPSETRSGRTHARVAQADRTCVAASERRSEAKLPCRARDRSRRSCVTASIQRWGGAKGERALSTILPAPRTRCKRCSTRRARGGRAPSRGEQRAARGTAHAMSPNVALRPR